MRNLTKDEAAARAFAIGAHGDQKYGDLPYSAHLTHVYDVTVEFNLPANHRVAAWVHDVLEDTGTTTSTLELVFGSTVTLYVWAVTGVGKTRKERNHNAYCKMFENPIAIPLKLCDRIANGRASKANNPRMFGMYRNEYPTFRTELYVRSRTSGIDCTPLWAELDRLFGEG